jgi:[ribosomal protein S18]-alanine N-acetyltransferase
MPWHAGMQPMSWQAPQPRSGLKPWPMSVAGQVFSGRYAGFADLADVSRIEAASYAFPWSLGNFEDSLASGYDFWVIESSQQTLVAYALLMWLPEEAHLLNITVSPALQRQGLGREILNCLCADVRERGGRSMLLEVRRSNLGAQVLYQSLGFAQIGIRKGYYASWNNSREDALVLSKHLSGNCSETPA